MSLVMGLPGEAPGDVEETDHWVAGLQREPLAVFPLFYAPTDRAQRGFAAGDMTPAQWRLFRRCWKLNLRRMPRLYWDNQRRCGVALGRRLLMRALARAQGVWWKCLMAGRKGK